MKLILLGVGTVGSGLLEMIEEKQSFLAKQDLSLSLVGIGREYDGSLEAIYNPSGLAKEKIVALKNQSWQNQNWGARKKSIANLLEEADYDVLVECTPTNLTDAEPALTYLKAALKRGKSVVTCNKGPIALFYPELSHLAAQNKAKLKIESTVLSGTPVFNLLENELKGLTINRITAILNGTTNYIIKEMEKGTSYQVALEQAQRLGYAEANPDADVLGYDSLAKIIILGNVLLGGKLNPDNVPFMGINHLKTEEVIKAKQENHFFKLVGVVGKNNDSVLGEVKLKQLTLSSPFASIKSNQNAILLETNELEEIMIVGPGAGKEPTAYGLFNDILSL